MADPRSAYVLHHRASSAVFDLSANEAALLSHHQPSSGAVSAPATALLVTTTRNPSPLLASSALIELPADSSTPAVSEIMLPAASNEIEDAVTSDHPTVDPLDLTCGSHNHNRITPSPIPNQIVANNNNDCDPSRKAMTQQFFEQRTVGLFTGQPDQFTHVAAASAQNEEAHKCDMCGKTFAVPARLTRHYRTHTGERPFVCEVCGKSFSVKENLSVHRRIHTKEKPYRCTHCGRGFEHSGKLHRHMRIHTGERPHQCRDCGKTFIQSGQLVIHMRSHTGEKPYVCTVCGKGFTCSKQLKVHSRTHTGERPYACDICGKTFAYNHVLKLHQMAHLGERLYKCTLCSETFSSKKALETHIKSHAVSPTRQSPVPSTSSAASPIPSASGSSHHHPTTTEDDHQTVRRNQSRNLMSGGGTLLESADLHQTTHRDRNERQMILPDTRANGQHFGPAAISVRPWNALSGSAVGQSAGARRQVDPSVHSQDEHQHRFAYPQVVRERLPPNHGLADPKSAHQLPAQYYPPQAPDHVHPSATNGVRDCPPALRPMPPLIPVSAAALGNTLRSLQQHLVHSAQQPTDPGRIQQQQDGQQRHGPPRKSSRFRDGQLGEGHGESSDSAGSSASSTPPLFLNETSTSADGTMTDGLRSTSVIRFAHRSNSSSSSPPSFQTE